MRGVKEGLYDLFNGNLNRLLERMLPITDEYKYEYKYKYEYEHSDEHEHAHEE
jgi:hypothetical protein